MPGHYRYSPYSPYSSYGLSSSNGGMHSKKKLLRIQKLKALVNKLLIYVLLPLAVLLVIVQLFYPSDKLLPGTTIEGVRLGGMKKSAAIVKLNELYKMAPLPIYLDGDKSDAFIRPTTSDIGMTVDNKERITNLDYPLILKIIPLSLWWGHYLTFAEPPVVHRDNSTIDKYLSEKFNGVCKLDPVNAALKPVDGAIKTAPATVGGVCKLDDLKSALRKIVPKLDGGGETIDGNITRPSITTEGAQKVADSVNNKIKSGLQLFNKQSSQTIPASEVASWIDFSYVGKRITFSINKSLAQSYLEKFIAPKTLVNAGVTSVTLLDYSEKSRDTGKDGSVINYQATLANIKDYLDQDKPRVDIVTDIVPPSVKYNYTYSQSDSSLESAMSKFANSRPGQYEATLVELTGDKRHASYRGDVVETTASTYKLFVAYSVLKRIDNGAWDWSDYSTGGYSTSQCFDRMIIYSDNACAENLLMRIGFKVLTDEARELGCSNTTFENANMRSTANDEAHLLALLATGRVLSQSSRDKLIGAMKRDVYRAGIPSGISSSVVANKVGFLDNILNDAAIVYDGSSTYVLVIMTQNSSWSSIAALANTLHSWRLI